MLKTHVIFLTSIACLLAACQGEMGATLEGETQGSPQVGNPGDPNTPNTPGDKVPGVKIPGKTDPATPEPKNPVTSAKIWKLTPRQISLTAASLIGEELDADLKLDLSARLFSNEPNHLDLNGEHVEALGAFIEEVVDRALKVPESLAPCAARPQFDRACVKDVITAFGARAWRRPMTQEEVDSYLFRYDALLVDQLPAQALKTSLEAMLTSPHFLFRTELGPPEQTDQPRVLLTSYERASALSYLFTNAPPDEALRRAAASDALLDPAEMGRQAQRLLERDEAPEGLVDFFMELTGAHKVIGLAKDEARFPLWTYRISELLHEETRRYVGYMLSKPGTTFEDLLTALYSILNKELAEYYGVPFKPVEELGGGWGVVEMPTPYGGLLTQGSVMSVHARFADSDIVHRALFVYNRLLCRTAPPLPEDLDVNPIEPSDDKTQRQNLAKHTEDAACASCHAVFDPLGYPFELLDGVGRSRTMEANQMIDPVGQIVGFSAFDSPRSLSAQLGAYDQTHQCLSRRLVDYAIGRQNIEGSHDAISLTLLDLFTSKQHNLRDTLIALAAHELFWTREK